MGFAAAAVRRHGWGVMKRIAPNLAYSLAPWLLLSAFVLFPAMTAVGVAQA